MGVLSFEPLWLYTSEKTVGYTDENGNRHPASYKFTRHVRCDVVPAGTAESRDFGDGEMKSYSYTLYVNDLSCRDIAFGEKIRWGGEHGEHMSNEYVVKGFHRYQTFCIMWV
jgi:hypothetical protein